MTPKEKANELVDKYYDLNYEYDGVCRMDWAKDGALIAVNYLIDEQTMWQNGEPNPVLYWQEVKKEIEKI